MILLLDLVLIVLQESDSIGHCAHLTALGTCTYTVDRIQVPSSHVFAAGCGGVLDQQVAPVHRSRAYLAASQLLVAPFLSAVASSACAYYGPQLLGALHERGRCPDRRERGHQYSRPGSGHGVQAT